MMSCLIYTYRATVLRVRQENMKVLAEKWKNMSDERKRPYEMQAQCDARRYQTEVQSTSIHRPPPKLL